MKRESRCVKGSRFGMLLVIGIIPGSKRKRVACSCDCGNVRAMYRWNITSSGVDSCGCMTRQKKYQGMFKHGLIGTPTYYTWANMKKRCGNPKAHNYRYYGGLGIRVCDRWQNSFADFQSDMGDRPKGCTLDRIDRNGNYEPGNCRWATTKQQSRNRSNIAMLTVDGETKCISEWAEISGIPAKAIYVRAKTLGWNPTKAIWKPLRKAIERGEI